jgi:isoquinoline 1-oxidoreductase beta subunit
LSSINRRKFLGATAIAGAGLGLGIGLYVVDRVRKKSEFAHPLSGDAKTEDTATWVHIAPNNDVTITISRSEMGQGVETALAMLVAEELDADWQTVRTRWATADPAYGNQHTAASSSIHQLWQSLREVGAAARQMLIAAAAQTWGVSAGLCSTDSGEVLHPDGQQRLSFGSLADQAAILELPEYVTLKEPTEFKLIGHSVPRLDIPKKVDGTAIFGWDVQVPGMLIAAITRCPVKGGHIVEYESDAALSIDGVRAVVPVSDPYAPSATQLSERTYGLAVVADNYWAAQSGQRALKITWNNGPNERFDTAAIRRMLMEWAEGSDAQVIVDRGDIESASGGTSQIIKSVYEAPYLAHMTMSPMCCTADVRDDRCEVWAPTQSPDLALRMTRDQTGLSRDAITINKTYLGGGFGRRQRQDYVGEAVQVSKALRRPVKVLWSREEDVRGDFFRPMSYDILNARLDDDGFPIAWQHRISSTEVRVFSSAGSDSIPYDIPNKFVDLATPTSEQPVRVTTWRGVGHSQNAFFVESFLDELAHAGQHDPLDYRRHLLRHEPRYIAVLELAAARAGWNDTLPVNQYRGIAMDNSGGSIAAEIVEVSIDEQQEIKVHKVTCVVDCGMAVNPRGVEAQLEGAIIDGLTAALYSEITIERGRVQQSNFHDYPLMRMNQIPEIDVYIVPNQSPDLISGVGEVGLPPVAPAIANAVFAATGKRIRKLPIRLNA